MPKSTWSESERWVWGRIRAGNVADFNERMGSPKDPRASEGWDATRLLSVAFLREIFYCKNVRDEIAPEGVRIAGAVFRERLELPYGRLHCQLWLDRCRFEKAIDLSRQTIAGWLSLKGSFVAKPDKDRTKPDEDPPSVNLTDAVIEGGLNLAETSIEGTLIMNGLAVSRDLFMHNSKEWPATFQEVDLSAANVKGQVNLNGATVTSRLLMNRLRAESLFLDGSRKEPSTFDEVDMTAAIITGQLSLVGTTVNRNLTMKSVEVGQNLFMHPNVEEKAGDDPFTHPDVQPAKFARVDLTAADVKGYLDISGATVTGTLCMNRLLVGQDLRIEVSTRRFVDIRLTAAALKRCGLSLQGARVETLSITGLEVGKDLFTRSHDEPGRSVDIRLTAAALKRRGLSLEGAKVETSSMTSLEVGKDLFIRRHNKPGWFADIDLTAAVIKGQLSLSGARVGSLDMTSLEVGKDLIMQGSWDTPAKFAAVNLAAAKVNGKVDLTGATVKRWLNMSGLQVGQDLIMISRENWRATFKNVSLAAAKINGRFDLSGATVRRRLNMSDLHVGRDLVARAGQDYATTFPVVELGGANITGDLELTLATVNRKLDMTGVRIGQDLYMVGDNRQPATFAEICLTAAKVQGRVLLRTAKVGSRLDMSGLEVGSDLFMDSTIFNRRVRLLRADVRGAISFAKSDFLGTVDVNFAKVGTDFRLAGATIDITLDITNTNIGGELGFCDERGNGVSYSQNAFRKGRRPTVNLQNTRASVLYENGRWPQRVELDGFFYVSHRGLAAEGARPNRQEFRERFIGECSLLTRDTTYTPQVYEHLAAVYGARGEPVLAGDALYASRERARKEVVKELGAQSGL
jgi:uncharacterized protein YjbI with pentapeptide repeats